MDRKELEEKLDRAFSKRMRIVAENSRGKLSSTWMFWGKKNDFYFGPKGLLSEFKVSFHENGFGYLAFHKPYYLQKKAEGLELASKTVFEWRLPEPTRFGAAHAASVILPGEYFRSAPLNARDGAKTLVLGVEEKCAAEIGIFLSQESHETLESKFLQIGRPIFFATLEKGLRVSIVVRSTQFDPGVLPTPEHLRASRGTLLQRIEDLADNDLNAMLWNKPEEGEALQVIDIGGVTLNKSP